MVDPVSIAFTLVKGAFNVYKGVKAKQSELGEYEEDAEELFDRVDALIPIVMRVEHVLSPEFIMALHLIKLNMDRVKTTIDDTHQYVKKFAGAKGGLRLIANQVSGGLIESLSPDVKAAGAFCAPSSPKCRQTSCSFARRAASRQLWGHSPPP